MRHVFDLIPTNGKEILRFYPVSYFYPREANQDQVMPLSKPLLLKSGKSVTEITVSKGTNIFTPPFIYNRFEPILLLEVPLTLMSLRNKDIFGEDAHLFNPDRWLEHKPDTKSGTVGVYGNMFVLVWLILIRLTHPQDDSWKQNQILHWLEICVCLHPFVGRS